MINIKGMLEVEKLCTEYLSAHLLDSMSGEYSQDNQYVFLQLKIDLTPEQFVLAGPLQDSQGSCFWSALKELC